MRFAGYLLFASLLTPTTFSDVLTVDDSGGSDFLSIGQAIFAASPGDTILVRPGLYPGFFVDKDVRILGESTDIVSVRGEVFVFGLAPGGVVVLDRLEIRPVQPTPALRVISAQGVVHAQRCSLEGGSSNVGPQAAPGAVLSSGSVFFTDCTIGGSWAWSFDDILTNAPGMRIDGADVAMDGSDVAGGEGVVTFGGLDATWIPGAEGVRLLSGTLFATDSRVIGGRGGNAFPAYSCSDPIPPPGSDGGPGMAAAVPSTFLGSLVAGGAGGLGGYDACGGGSADGAPGPPFIGVPPTFLSGIARTSNWTSRWWDPSSNGGAVVEVELSGAPGDEVFLAWSDQATFNPEPALRGVRLPDMPTIEMTPFAVLPASGQLTTTLELLGPDPGEPAVDRFVQAYFIDSNGSLALGTPGSVVVFSAGAPYCTVGQNSTGRPGRIAATGSPSPQLGALTLTAFDVPPNRFGFFLSSGLQGSSSLPPPSQGILCLELPIVRHGLINTGPAGQATLGVDLSTLPVVAGDTWNFQFWFRDSNPGDTSNTTNGVAVVVCD